MQFEEYSGESQLDVAIRLKREYQKQKKVLNNFTKPQATSTVALYKIALMMVKRNR